MSMGDVYQVDMPFWVCHYALYIRRGSSLLVSNYPLASSKASVCRKRATIRGFTLFVYYFPIEAVDIISGLKMKVEIGELIRQELLAQGRSITWLAGQLNCDRTNIYNIFKRDNIDLKLLSRISLILNRNFIRELSEEIDNEIKK